MRRALVFASVVLAVLLSVAAPASAIVPLPHPGEYIGKAAGEPVVIHVAVQDPIVDVIAFHWKKHPFKHLRAHVAKDHYAFSADFGEWQVHGGWIFDGKPVPNIVTGTLTDKDEHVHFEAHFFK